MGYITQLQGRTAEAQQLYQKVFKEKPSDTTLVAIAANNSAVINGSQNVFDSRRKLKMTRTALDENEIKFTARQKQVLSVNQCLFLGSTGQVKFEALCNSFYDGKITNYCNISNKHRKNNFRKPWNS